MELSEKSIHDVIHPTAAFSTASSIILEDAPPSQDDMSSCWQTSFLNPKNRIDSLEMHHQPLWKIDGCTALGSQFYAIPLFLDPMHPMRVDVHIPEPSSLPASLRDLLNVDATFHTRDKSRVLQLGLTRHVLRILQSWATRMDNPRDIYKNLPFGSRIVLENFPVDVSQASIIIAPSHALERKLLSVADLQKFWGPEIQLPGCIDISQVSYLSQLHDSVCLVKIDSKVWIFKALTSYPKYLYHELRQLLRISPHPNIVSRPVHLVTKRCSFGGKIAVLGFTLEYHTGGSLRDLIPFLQLHNNVDMNDKIKWASQLSSALLHLRETNRIFYPDLRLDNIVLSESGKLVMVDFEQRGVWCEFAAPEINAIEYIRLLAVDEDVPKAASDRFCKILSRMLPNWTELNQGEDYRWPSHGYNIPWACLTPTEQESCEVYMLGRVLWCIFEAKSAPQRAAAWLSYRWEPTVEFPGYTRTPQPLRDLIDRCTRGRQPGLSRYIVREGNKLVLRELEGTSCSTPELVQSTAKSWWTKEIRASENWLQARLEGMEQGDWNENYYNRPTLRQVYKELEEFALAM